MTTSELVKALAERLAVSQRQARALLDLYLAAITRQLGDHNAVTLRNFGTFTIRTVAAKQLFLPALGAHCLIPAHYKLDFKASKKLRDEVNNREVSRE